MGQSTEKILGKCKELGIELNIHDRALCPILDRFEEVFDIYPQLDGGIRVIYNFGVVSKSLTIHKNGKYSYSEGLCVG